MSEPENLVRAFLTVLQQLSWGEVTTEAVRRRLLESFEAAQHAGSLAVTELGRHLPGPASLKHKVKTMWRRLREQGLRNEDRVLYRALAHALLKGLLQPVLLVDWTACNGQALLSVALAHDGRALPLYLELHPLSDFGKSSLEAAFLKTLHREILPVCEAVVCTDAGYRSAWFDEVEAQGWDYLGRLVPNVQLQLVGATAEVWVEADALALLGTSTPEELGHYRVGKSVGTCRRVVRYHGRLCRTPSQRRGPSPKGGDHGKKYRRQAERGWLLVTSLTAEQLPAEALVALYASRMQIEELFRSVKSPLYGQGAGESRSHSAPVLAGLWLLASLRAVVLHLVGLVAEQRGWHHHYQTNTSDRRVLSLMSLGELVLRHHDQRQLTPARLRHALHLLQRQAERDALVQRTLPRLLQPHPAVRQAA